MASYTPNSALAAIKLKSFPYTSWMYPDEFANYYRNLPFVTPNGKLLPLNCIKYCSKLVGPRSDERIRWRKAVSDYFNVKGWEPALKDWVMNDRSAAVFSGHGLPEELSLACHLAMQVGYKTEATIVNWARQMLGIDCNGFVNAYLTSLGLFTRPLHWHASYLDVSPAAGSLAEVDADSIITYALPIGAKGFRVKNNGAEGGHILVVNGWKGNNLEVTDQAGLHEFDGPKTAQFVILSEPPPGAKPLDRVYTICKKANMSTPAKTKLYSQLVYITRPMQSY